MWAEVLLVVVGTGCAAQPSLPPCGTSSQHKLHAIPVQPQKSCWLHCGGDLGGGKAKGRGYVGWSDHAGPLVPCHLLAQVGW